MLSKQLWCYMRSAELQLEVNLLFEAEVCEWLEVFSRPRLQQVVLTLCLKPELFLELSTTADLGVISAISSLLPQRAAAAAVGKDKHFSTCRSQKCSSWLFREA